MRNAENGKRKTGGVWREAESLSQPGTHHPPPTTHHPPPAPPIDVGAGLASLGFLGLLVTQFLVALNDNMFRWLVIPIGKQLLRHQGYKPEDAQDIALTAGAICFLLPFVLLAAPAGYLADRFSKRNVMVGCKVAETVIMVLAVASILSGNLVLMLGAMALLASQATMFSASKLGSIPEIVRPERISAANGVIAMTAMVAVIAGCVAGNYLFDSTTLSPEDAGPGQYRWGISAAALVGVAALGLLASLCIGRLRPANPSRPVPRNPFAQTYRDLGALVRKRPLLLAALGGTYFWTLGVLAQTNIDKLATPELVSEQKYVGPLLAVLILGIGAGGLLAGILSRDRIEIGLVPVGALGMGVASILLFFIPQGTGEPISAAYFSACLWLFVMGAAAGLFDIPLEAYMQHHSPAKSRGSIMAAYNFLAFSGMLLAGVVFWLSASVLGMSARHISLAAGVVTLGVAVLIVWIAPLDTLRLVARVIVRLFYRIRVEGIENLPKQGGALLVPNHVSWIDGLLLMFLSPRPIRLVANPRFLPYRLFGRVIREVGVIPISPESKRSVIESLRTAREALRQGELVCIFPEGDHTRTGQILSFQRGFLRIHEGTGVPLIPVSLGGLWGSVFSFEGGKYFWKWPRRWPYPVSIRFGEPIFDPKDAQQVRLAVQELGIEAMRKDPGARPVPARSFLRMCRSCRRRPKVADSTGAELTGGQLLIRSLILRRLLRRHVLAKGEARVGLLLPPSVPAVVANAALAIDRRVSVNLNYTLSSEVMNLCIAKAGIRHVLTSRKLIEKLQLDVHAELVCLEDFADKVTWRDKLSAAFQSRLLPTWLLARWLGLSRVRPDDLMTIVFTSGSTGQPKGVMLSHDNVGSTIAGFSQMLQLSKQDVVVGVLPFFHSFGYTITLWGPLSLDPKAVYHYNPLEGRQVGKVCREHGGTILVATPTFLRSYLRRCQPEDFKTLNVVFAGAERLPKDLADAFEQRFGVRPYEGYGATELSPVVSGNVPPGRKVVAWQQGCKEGTVGQPFPGVAAKVVDPDTGADLGTGKSGMLLVKGLNVMLGYLDQPDLTAQVIRDGWYTTGDIAELDAEGYIRITGRLSRFAKIGGEMVPLDGVQEAIGKALGLDEETVRLAVASVPDPKKGERLVVLHAGLAKSPEELCRALAGLGLPPLWIPSHDSFCRVDALPLLGTGKLDLRRLKDLALAQFPPQGC
jgi:acyl-[acyl-carrier-protein]-phospholipid O-acyltransferase/long-chain-fatty-acid--[acyl-carrier-protein] ligase